MSERFRARAIEIARSTGVIGPRLPMGKLRAGLADAASALSVMLAAKQEQLGLAYLRLALRLDRTNALGGPVSVRS